MTGARQVAAMGLLALMVVCLVPGLLAGQPMSH